MITQGEAKPRWEWRTFDASLNAIEGRVAGALEHVAPHTSAEIYLLRLGGPQNAKIRDGILDVKRLQQVDVIGLELWEPVRELGEDIVPWVESRFAASAT